MDSINLQEFTEDAAYQVHAVLETISRLGERVDVYDGERLVGTILRGDPIPEEEGRSHTDAPPATFPPIEEALERHHQRLEQYEAEEQQAADNVA